MGTSYDRPDRDVCLLTSSVKRVASRDGAGHTCPLKTEIPHGLYGVASEQYEHHDDEEIDDVENGHAPKEPSMPSARVQEAAEERHYSQLGQREAQHTKPPCHEGPEDDAFLPVDSEKNAMPSTAVSYCDATKHCAQTCAKLCGASSVVSISPGTLLFVA
jgi:hypothetical protein